MEIRRRRSTPGTLLAAGALALTAPACESTAGESGAGEYRGRLMQMEVTKPDLVLTDTDGEPFDLRAETDGRVTLLFFGYTRCPDICPVHMSNLGAVFRELLPEVRNQLRVVFVTTDPERDTPEVLREWLNGFDRSFVGLRGPLEKVNRALAEMKLPGVAVAPTDHGDGPPLIGHPASVIAFDRAGTAVLRYPFGVRQEDWLHDLPRLVNGS